MGTFLAVERNIITHAEHRHSEIGSRLLLIKVMFIQRLCRKEQAMEVEQDVDWDEDDGQEAFICRPLILLTMECGLFGFILLNAHTKPSRAVEAVMRIKRAH